MTCTTCRTGRTALRDVSRAMAKAAGAKLRDLGALATAPRWERRSAVCESCPLRVVSRGTSYCGTPFLSQLDRDPATDGCGCPCRDKARAPSEHCPIDARHRPARQGITRCTCKWCDVA